MTAAGDLKKGNRVLVNGVAFAVVEVRQQTVSARGGGTLVRLRLRNLRSGQLIEHAAKASDRLTEPDFELRQVQYLFDEGGKIFHFLEQASYEQFELSREHLVNQVGYLLPDDELRAMFLDGECIGISLPSAIVLTVSQTQTGARGDTVSKVTKLAIMETGLEIAVPLFVNEGDKISVDTSDGHYLRRA